MSQRRGLRDGVVQTMGANIAVMAVSVVVGGLSARMLGVDGRGELAAIVLVPQVAFVIAILGVHEAVVFHVARRHFTIEQVFGAALAITAPLALVGSAASVFLTPAILSHYGAHIRIAAQIYAATIPMGLVQGVMTRVLQGTKQFVLWNVVRVLVQLCPLITMGGLWLSGRMTPVAFALGNLTLWTAMTVALAVPMYRMGLLRASLGAAPTKAVWSYSWRAGVGTVPQIANFRLDQVLIAIFLTAHSLGLYTTAVSWSVGFLPLSSAYGSVIFPEIAAAAHAAESFGRAMRRGLAVLFAGWVAYFAVTPLMFRLIYGPEFAAAMPTVLVLGVASLFLSANQMLAEGVKGLGRPMLVSISELCGLAATALLLTLLIPPFGIIGAALASLGAYGLTSAVLLVGLHQSAACTWRDLLMIRVEEWQTLAREVWALIARLPARPAVAAVPVRPIAQRADSQPAD